MRSLGAVAVLLAATPLHGEEPLAFEVDEGAVRNYFFRQGGVAAHVVATSGKKPRLIVAFPAGNSGAGLWFEPSERPVTLRVTAPGPIEGQGKHGVRFRLSTDAGALCVRAVLGSIRTLRDVALGARLPEELAPPWVEVEGRSPAVSRIGPVRRMLDGHLLDLRLTPLDGARVEFDRGSFVVRASRGRSVELVVEVASDYPPLTPIPLDELTTLAADSPDRRALAFLAYKEKLLAGSWRFLTYFGRDTLLSLAMLMPVLKPDAIEAGLGAVLERLGPDGAVAHEEDIGEQAALDHRRAGGSGDAPVYDYKMVDGDFLLAPVLARYLLDTAAGSRRAAGFLGRHRPLVEKNLERVLRLAKPYADSPRGENLIALGVAEKVGQWRDSDEGLGGGRIPFDVNVALVPAALGAAARLYRAVDLPARAAHAERLGRAWRDVGRHFRIAVAPGEANARIATYAKEQGLPAPSLVTRPVLFSGLALDAQGKPIPVMHTDDGFALLFGEPSSEELDAVAAHLIEPFPVGLRTPVGLVVANPAYAADVELRRRFGRDRYHGAVIWSWQQAMLAAGLRRQLERTDLSVPLRAKLAAAEAAVWQAIYAAGELRGSELWTWKLDRGRFVKVPFGQGHSDADESNAVQLWSTVYLGLAPPIREGK